MLVYCHSPKVVFFNALVCERLPYEIKIYKKNDCDYNVNEAMKFGNYNVIIIIMVRMAIMITMETVNTKKTNSELKLVHRKIDCSDDLSNG